MLRIFAEKCTWVLLKKDIVQDDKKSIYIYGFELFWSTFLCIASILSLGVIYNYLSSAVLFLLFFMPIRMVAGGYHAKSYGACFLLTNGVSILCVFISKWLWYTDELWVSLFLLLIMLLSTVYIWRKAPVNLGKHSVDACRIQKSRKYAHYILIIEVILTIAMKILIDSYISYTAIIATCAVALMIYAAQQEEVR